MDAQDQIGVVFDLDGTVFIEEQLIPGVDEAIGRLRQEGVPVVFLTNDSSRSRTEQAGRLSRAGVPATEADVISTQFVMVRHLQETYPRARVFCIGGLQLGWELTQAGMELTADPRLPGQTADVVVVGFDPLFNYEKLHCALAAIRGGARVVVSDRDATYPSSIGGEMPGCGAVVAAIEYAAGRPVDFVAGKPNPLMLELALERLGVPPGRCLMVGDRLESDIVLGQQAGAQTALVLTGVTAAAGVGAAEAGAPAGETTQPDHVLESAARVAEIALQMRERRAPASR